MKHYSEKTINAFLGNQRVVDIAKSAGISTKTVRKYREDAELQEILTERRREIMHEAVKFMQASLVECTAELMRIIRSNETPAQTKVNAIQVMFNQCRDWTISTEVLPVIEDLELKRFEE